jgi:DNA-binding MarR family transcriptional regulator
MLDKKKICRLRDIHRAIAQVEAEIEASFGLNFNEAMLLCCMKEKDNMSAGEIAECMGLMQPNASKVIGSLEKDGFLKRKIDKVDKRIVRYSLTKKGTDKIESIDCDNIALPEILDSI